MSQRFKVGDEVIIKHDDDRKASFEGLTATIIEVWTDGLPYDYLVKTNVTINEIVKSGEACFDDWELEPL